MQPHPIGPAWPQYVFPIVIAGVVLAIRMRRMSRAQPLRLERLWIVPALYAMICVATLAAKPPTPLGWAAFAAGLGLGGVLGWWRGKTTRIVVDPATHQLNQQASPAAMLILVALIVVKMTIGTQGRAAHWDALGNALLAVALGTFALMRVEMYLRGSRLLRAHTGGVFS